jgi:hypothetical protein
MGLGFNPNQRRFLIGDKFDSGKNSGRGLSGRSDLGWSHNGSG